ncbi:MAG: AAA family ATPase [Gemmatimonadota bacterium]
MYHLQSLGGVSLRDPSGEVVRFRSRKHLSLLLYLTANAGRVHTRSELAALLWTSPPERARHSLSQAIYDLRGQLDGAFVTGPAEELRLDAQRISYDARELELALKRGQLERAIEFCNGPFACNLQSTGTDDFERWLEAERVRLQRLSRVTLRRYVEQCDSRGLWGEMCIAAMKLVEIDPLDELAHRALMRGLWLHGDRESALQHFEETDRRLEAELPGGFSSETRALAERIRSTPPARPTGDLDEDAELPLIGREEELEFLRTRARNLGRGGGSTVVVRGEGGIGKSRLVKAFVHSLGVEPVQCLESRCYPAEADIPYGPVVDGLRPVAGRVARELAPGSEAFTRLGHLFPEFDDFLEDEETDAPDPEAWRRRLYEEVADLLKMAATRQPIVWVVEDVQWIDATSASLLHCIARRLAEQPFLLITTFRTVRGDRVNASAPPVAGYVAGGRSETLTLGPLTEDQIASLVLCVRPDAEGTAAVSLAQHLSAGNPFYALEVFRAAVSSAEWAEKARVWALLTNARLSEVFRIRLQGLSDRSLHLLRSIAVLERYATPRNVSSVSNISLGECAALGEDLYARGLIQDDEDRVEFVNDITREYVYGQLTSMQRAALHSAAARLLCAEPDTGFATLARHYRLGGDREKAFDCAIRAAREASEAGGHLEASHMAALAVSTSRTRDETVRALRILADSELSTAQLQSAQEHFDRMLVLDPNMPLEERIAVKLSVVKALVERAEWTLGRQLVDALPLEIGDIQEPRGRLESEMERLHWSLKIAMRQADSALATSNAVTIRRLLSEGREAGTLTAIASVSAACSLAAYYAFFETAEKALEQVEAISSLIKDVPTRLAGRVQLFRGLIQTRRAEWDIAEHEIKVAIDLATKRNDLVELSWLLNNLACCYLEQGKWEEFNSVTKRVEDIQHDVPVTLDVVLPLSINKANALFYQGKSAEAAEQYSKCLAIASSNHSIGFIPELTACVGLTSLQRGDLAAVRNSMSLLDIPDESGGVQERFKVQWFRAYTSLQAQCARSSDRFFEVAEKERLQDTPSYLKLLWIGNSFYGRDNCPPEAANKEALRKSLRETNLLWFVGFFRRWRYAADAKSQGRL